MSSMSVCLVGARAFNGGYNRPMTKSRANNHKAMLVRRQLHVLSGKPTAPRLRPIPLLRQQDKELFGFIAASDQFTVQAAVNLFVGRGSLT